MKFVLSPEVKCENLRTGKNTGKMNIDEELGNSVVSRLSQLGFWTIVHAREIEAGEKSRRVFSIEKC